MKQVLNTDILEILLFSCEEMLYSSALLLIGDRDDARDAERDILQWIWDLLDTEDGRLTIKKNLIKVVHRRFLLDNQTDQESSYQQNYPWKNDGLHIVRDAERKMENGSRGDRRATNR